ELVLEITSSERFLLGENASKQFLPVGGVIGRSQGCDWVIPDQSRHLSGRHAQISAEGEDFYIIDLSTNGVFLNGGTSPLDKDKPHKLRSEDTLMMGDIQFKVVIHLDAICNGFTPTSFAPTTGEKQDKGAPILDPLEMLRQKMPNALNNATDNASNNAQGLSPSNSEKHQLDQWHGESVSMPDGLSAIRETFDAPAMHSELLPEDWLSIDLGDTVLPRRSPQTSQVFSSPPMPTPGIRQSSSPKQALRAEQPQPNVDPFKTPVEITPSAMVSVIDSYQTISQPVQTNSQAQLQSNEHLAAFCRGLGVSEDALASVDTVVLMEQAGEALKETFAGMVHVMKSRASLKNEFRMDMTLVQADKNNPLKFAVDEQQVLQHFLKSDRDSFLTIPAALSESFTDIQEHQIGVMAAVQGSLTQLLGKLDPEQLEERFDRGQAKGFSMAGKRARYWDAYKEYHADIQQEESTFSSVFGDTFSTTYKDQVDRLKAAKRSGEK
ncbi:MAG: type VI secretion system-associated FHA domain protein TagH, partial [Pseudomonadales bacterium]|nr:type VI secretion system-associated FHA domain protein TagH [Pseudomonadales bacterium]